MSCLDIDSNIKALRNTQGCEIERQLNERLYVINPQRDV